MKYKFKHPINLIATYLAVISFLLGSLILIIHKTKLFGHLYLFGYSYVIIATIINSLMLIILLINTIINYKDFKDFKENLISICIVLVNIPITFFYINLT